MNSDADARHMVRMCRKVKKQVRTVSTKDAKEPSQEGGPEGGKRAEAEGEAQEREQL